MITLFVNIKAWWHFEFFQLPVMASEVRIVVSPLLLFCIFRTMWEASHSKQYHVYKWNIFIYYKWLMALVNLHMINIVLQVCVCVVRMHACEWYIYCSIGSYMYYMFLLKNSVWSSCWCPVWTFCHHLLCLDVCCQHVKVMVSICNW